MIDGIITAVYFGGKTHDRLIKSAITFYAISGAILVFASLLYYVELKNRFSRFFYAKLKQQIAEKPKMGVKEKYYEIL